jgi:hypothetical protein
MWLGSLFAMQGLLQVVGFLAARLPGRTLPCFIPQQQCFFPKGRGSNRIRITIGAFARCFTKKGPLDSRFHRYLIDAEDFREVADYIPCAPIAPEKVEEIIQRASEFLTMAEDFLRGAGGKSE